MRDSRRLASKAQKAEVLFLQDELCFVCRVPLCEGAVHFHHLKPWAHGGSTEIENLAALCIGCHRLEHRKNV
jgi:5-methylcytosine-specific restriction endonuclease McrA